jgi:hypothetical protein
MNYASGMSGTTELERRNQAFPNLLEKLEVWK